MTTNATTPATIAEPINNDAILNQLVHLDASGTNWGSKPDPSTIAELRKRKDAIEAWMEKYGDSDKESMEDKINDTQTYLDSIDDILSEIDEQEVEEIIEAPIKPATKSVAKVKKVKVAKEPMFTCSEAMGIIMRQNPSATAEVLINKADTLYIKKTGKESNLFQMGKYHSFASKFLKGYNSK